jgi:hypothetical protein
MAAPQSSSPPRPRRVIQVGVTGHRLNRISPQMAAVLPDKCAQALRAIAQAWAAGAAEPVLLRVISPLAEGADRMVAQAGLALGADLQCPLPFHAEEYKRDFATEASKREFDALLARASAVFDAGGERSAAEAAYERAGQIVVQQSDVLIAIWDGEASRGRGGTAQMVDEALALGVTVVWLHAAESATARVLFADEKGNRTATPLDDWLRARDSMRAGGSMHSGSRATSPPGAGDARARRQQEHADRVYFAERQPRFNAGWFFRWFRDFVAEGRLWPGSMRMADFEESARADWSASMGNAEGGNGLPEATRNYLLDKLCPHYAWADGLSTYYGGLLRSGSVIANLFAASAVFFALVGLLAESIDLWDKRVTFVARNHLLHAWFNRLPSMIEFLLITAILVIIHRGRRNAWHQRWLKYRQLAERLRQDSFLAPLGCSLLKPRETPHFGADLNRSWVDGMFQAITRDIGMAPGSVETGYLLAVGELMDGILKGQIRYHELNHERMERLNHRLHRVGIGLFAITLVACVVHVAVAGEAAWLLMLATAPPALGAALYAITSQGEFARSADRSLAMKHELTQLRAIDLPAALKAGSQTFDELRKVARSVAEVMISETNDWNIVFKYRPLSLPG